MQISVRAVHDLISAITPSDEIEALHRSDALAWLTSTDDIFRRVRPATPATHLVSYCAVVDPADLSHLLVDHVNARLWLPPGGHVEPGEHPAHTARRELREELGLDADFSVVGERPLFVTMTETVGIDHGHTDVSLWWVLAGRRENALTPDQAEFDAVRWWSPDEIDDADPAGFDPHFRRFRAKLSSSLTPEREPDRGIRARP